MFKKRKIYWPQKSEKNGPQKLLIISPDPFNPQSSPGHSPQPKIDFPYHEISRPDICSLICEVCIPQHSTPWLPVTTTDFVIKGEVWWVPCMVMGNPTMQPQKMAFILTSKMPYLRRVWGWGHQGRTILLQILYWIKSVATNTPSGVEVVWDYS